MIKEILNGRSDEGLWIRPDVKEQVVKPNNLSRDVRVPQSLAYARLIQLDCLKAIKKVRIK